MPKRVLCSNRENKMRNYDLDAVKEFAVISFFMVCLGLLFIVLLAVFGTAG